MYICKIYLRKYIHTKLELMGRLIYLIYILLKDLCASEYTKGLFHPFSLSWVGGTCFHQVLQIAVGRCRRCQVKYGVDLKYRIPHVVQTLRGQGCRQCGPEKTQQLFQDLKEVMAHYQSA